MVGADENSNRDMGIVIEHLEWIRRAVGTAVMPVHHSGKDGKTYRGASALYSAAYASIEIAKDDDVITVTCDKAKTRRNSSRAGSAWCKSKQAAHYATVSRDELLYSCPATR